MHKNPVHTPLAGNKIYNSVNRFIFRQSIFGHFLPCRHYGYIAVQQQYFSGRIIQQNITQEQKIILY